MSSLWTPDGEHQVPPKGDEGPGGRAPADTAASETDQPGDPSGDTLRAAAAAMGLDIDQMGPEELEQLRTELAEMMRVRREVAATPASEMLTNHMMRLFDLTTIYLEGDPPAFGEAATVIEAFRAVLDALGDRLGDSEPTLREALGQLQMLFVQLKNAQDSAAG
ncbi:MAG: hypothetical protein M9942_11515 [Microthrixaceae bacterium]|nr:hypothetical protein [Microthrixaceae bacterium]